MLRRPSFFSNASSQCAQNYSSSFSSSSSSCSIALALLGTTSYLNLSATPLFHNARRFFPVSHHSSLVRQRLVRAPEDTAPIMKHRPKLEREAFEERLGDIDAAPKSRLGCTVELMLYDLALSEGSLVEPPWLPLPAISRRLPEDILADLDSRPELEHGLRSLIELELPFSVNIRFDTVSKCWVAQKRPMSESLVQLADCFNKLVLSQPEHVVQFNYIAGRLPPEMRRLAEQKYNKIQKALQRAVDQVPGLAFTTKRHGGLSTLEIVVKPQFHHVLPGAHNAKARKLTGDDVHMSFQQQEQQQQQGQHQLGTSQSGQHPQTETAGGITYVSGERTFMQESSHGLDPAAAIIQTRLRDSGEGRPKNMIPCAGEAELAENSDNMFVYLHELLRQVQEQKRIAQDKADAEDAKSRSKNNNNTGANNTTAAASKNNATAKVADLPIASATVMLTPAVAGPGSLEKEMSELIPAAPEFLEQHHVSRRRAEHCDFSNQGASEKYFEMTSAKQVDHGRSHIDVRRLLRFVPSFFVPLELAVRQQPLIEAGYTAAHIEEYFALGATRRNGVNQSGIEIVSLPSTVNHIDDDAAVVDAPVPEKKTMPLHQQPPLSVAKIRKFVRIIGYNGSFEMSDILMVNSKLFAYYPRPYLALPYLNYLTVPNRWVGLRELLTAVGLDAARSLPFHREEALLFFAQLQHWFNFSPRNGGMISRKPNARDVGEPRSPALNLDHETTPLPFVFNEAYRLAKFATTPSVPLHTLEMLFPYRLLQNMWQCFGDGAPRTPKDRDNRCPMADAATWANFARAHNNVFVFDESNKTLAVRQRLYYEEFKASGDLETEIRYALQQHAKQPKRLQALRRRLALQRDPNHRFSDARVLARAVHDSVLPKDRCVLVKRLMYALTNDMRDFLPKTGLYAFLLRFPEFFTVFEKRLGDGRLVTFVCRASVQPPDGSLTQDTIFTARDAVLLTAEILQRAAQVRGMPDQTVADIVYQLPTGMKQRGVVSGPNQLVSYLERLPHAFVLTAAVDTVRVRLLQVPTEEDLKLIDRIASSAMEINPHHVPKYLKTLQSNDGEDDDSDGDAVTTRDE